MHYKDEEEAREKWYRRINKINWDDLIIIMAENESFNYNEENAYIIYDDFEYVYTTFIFRKA